MPSNISFRYFFVTADTIEELDNFAKKHKLDYHRGEKIAPVSERLRKTCMNEGIHVITIDEFRLKKKSIK